MVKKIYNRRKECDHIVKKLTQSLAQFDFSSFLKIRSHVLNYSAAYISKAQHIFLKFFLQRNKILGYFQNYLKIIHINNAIGCLLI